MISYTKNKIEKQFFRNPAGKILQFAKGRAILMVTAQKKSPEIRP
jgi:hypothetical protein